MKIWGELVNRWREGSWGGLAKRLGSCGWKLLAIYEKSQINQTNNENTPSRRKGVWAMGNGQNGVGGGWGGIQEKGQKMQRKLMQSFLNEKIYDGNTQN